MLWAQASSNGSPRLPPAGRCHGGTGRENTHSWPLWGTLCAAGSGSAPVLTSSGAGTQMYSSLVVPPQRANETASFPEIQRTFSRVTGTNWWQGWDGRKTKTANKVTVDLCNMSDRPGYGSIWVKAHTLLLHFGEFFSFLGCSRLLNSPKRYCAGSLSAGMKWSQAAVPPPASFMTWNEKWPLQYVLYCLWKLEATNKRSENSSLFISLLFLLYYFVISLREEDCNQVIWYQ